MTRGRQGTTLVEVVLFAAVAGMIATVAWQIFFGSVRTSRATDRVVSGMSANLLASLYLERDLARLHEDPRRPVRFEVVANREATLSFHRHADTSPEDRWAPLPVEEVRYRFDSPTKRILRSVGGGAERPLPGLFERMNVRLTPPEVPGEATRVLVTTVSTPREWLRRPLEERAAHVRSTLPTSTSREDAAARATYDFWNPVPVRYASR